MYVKLVHVIKLSFYGIRDLLLLMHVFMLETGLPRLVFFSVHSDDGASRNILVLIFDYFLSHSFLT